MILVYLSTAIRVAVFALFAMAAVIAATHWAVQHGHLQPFGGLPRAVRRLGDPFMKPLERRIARGGGNPSNAPYYLFWLTLLGGLALIGLVEWLIGAVVALRASAAAGSAGIVLFVINGAFSLIILALFIRIIASWLGVSPYSRPMRVVYALTNWLLEPLKKVIPPLGPFDLSPLVAYLMLSLARWFVLGLF